MAEERLERIEKVLELVLQEIIVVKSTMATQEDIAKLDAKIDAVDAKLTAQIDAVDAKLTAKIDAVDTKLTAQIDAVDTKLTAKIDAVDTKLTTKIDLLDTKVERYGQAQQEDVYGLLKIMDKKLTDLSEDIKSIAEVTGEHEIRIRTLTRRPV